MSLRQFKCRSTYELSGLKKEKSRLVFSVNGVDVLAKQKIVKWPLSLLTQALVNLLWWIDVFIFPRNGSTILKGVTKPASVSEIRTKEHQVKKTRHQQSLEMLDTRGRILPHTWVAGDDEMGKVPRFRLELRVRNEPYMLAVPSNILRCFSEIRKTLMPK